MEPKLWRWRAIHPVLMETAEVIRIGPDAFRRNVGLQTGSKTLFMGLPLHHDRRARCFGIFTGDVLERSADSTTGGLADERSFNSASIRSTLP